jgi:tetraacyldisaccharide 4'-kinase
VLVLDDGFQHHRLARDVDLVCVDAALGFGNGHVLPRGPLREPLAALRAADALVVTRLPAGAPLPGLSAAAQRAGAGATPRFALALAPTGLRQHGGELRPLDSLRGARVGVLAALARPDSLRRTLTALGASIVAERLFPDHHLYTLRDVAGLPRPLRWITTGKDAVKLPGEWLVDHAIEVLEEQVRPAASGPDLVEWVLSRLAAAQSPRPEALARREKKGAPV